ncbi:MAG: serine/threonine protein kinase [Planctomycetaceae bacterium]
MPDLNRDTEVADTDNVEIEATIQEVSSPTGSTAIPTPATTFLQPMFPDTGSDPAGMATLGEPPQAVREYFEGQPIQQFGEYELLKEIARGGMGVVYLARQRGLKRLVALKMILSGTFASREAVERFKNEAEAAAQLDHPNIVPIYEVGERDGQHFFSMGYVEGQSLANLLREGPFEPRKAAELMISITDAVEYAHSKGVIHRDLKPANVLLDKQGQPRVTDFGLAKRTDDEKGLTASGQIMGTPSYMPPEQAAGETANISPVSDVYSLGAILYELLVGRPPFQAAKIIDTLQQVIHQDPVHPSLLNGTIHRDLETICLKCLEKNPASRYATAAELRNDLQRFLTGEPILARPVSTMGRVIGMLEREGLDIEIAQYSRLSMALIPVMVIPEVIATAVIELNGPGAIMGLANGLRAIAFLLIVGWFRDWQWRPHGTAERQVWSIWGGYLVACLTMGLSMRMRLGFDNAVEAQLYQPLSCLTGLAFVAQAGQFWGRSLLIAAAFFALPFVMAIEIRFAPLEFAGLWSIVLFIFARRLKRLSEQQTRQTVPSVIAAK